MMDAERCAHVGTLVEARGAGTVCTSCGLVVSSIIEEETTGGVVASAPVSILESRLRRRDVDFLIAACERLCLPVDEYRAQVENYLGVRRPKVYERNKRAFLAALIVTLSRSLNHPRVTKEVASVLGLRQGAVYREVKGIEKASGRTMDASDDTGVAKAGDIVPRIMTVLFAWDPARVAMKDRRKAITNARRMADVIDDSGILGGRTPSTIAAVAVHMTELETGEAGWNKASTP
ncbi:hypothetical protein KFL_003890250 [Klebsormidium nitens]|uniref:Transcription factor TFIIB cyclin-like domain-containing protein n=1 Tax=Klebsormidium nitens TaxID=105231 RepID=A0A1Y1IAG1_KLENI|nr:hypothetical protein KFL_003890250 [Klebsormidium nitens]|eukprot:GAQ87954.1 hypothetical protein KFL_003890250 [Klebsormidium nitens]